MIKVLWFIGLVYLIVVSLISVVAAVVTLEPHPKRMCLASELRSDYTDAERVWCRKQW